MSMLRPFLAQTLIPTDAIPGSWHWMGLTLKELLMVLGAVAVVTLLLFIWAAYFRKRPHRHSHHHHHHHSDDAEEASNSDSAVDSEWLGSGDRRYRRKRRRRREHRPRNPTLAETGGLPPVRSERPPDPLP